MVVAISLIVIVPLIAFWAWMFTAMTKNRELTPPERTNWTLAFVVFNVFAAAVYFTMIHQQRS